MTLTVGVAVIASLILLSKPSANRGHDFRRASAREVIDWLGSLNEFGANMAVHFEEFQVLADARARGALVFPIDGDAQWAIFHKSRFRSFLNQILRTFDPAALLGIVDPCDIERPGTAQESFFR
jgi:hypothetical protein